MVTNIKVVSFGTLDTKFRHQQPTAQTTNKFIRIKYVPFQFVKYKCFVFNSSLFSFSPMFLVVASWLGELCLNNKITHMKWEFILYHTCHVGHGSNIHFANLMPWNKLGRHKTWANEIEKLLLATTKCMNKANE